MILVLFVAVAVTGKEEAAAAEGAGCPEEDRLRARVGELEKELGDVRGAPTAA